MPHQTEPTVFCIGETRVNQDELQGYLESIGATGWETDAHDDISEIIEVNGRGCYLSFGTDLNKNISKVRKGNEAYIANILKQRHGAVVEHAFVNFQIVDVSRVFTHELVRHRAGTAISQESLRFVRADDLGYWIPGCWRRAPHIIQEFVNDLFIQHWTDCERRYQALLRISAVLEADAVDEVTQTFTNPDFWTESFDALPFHIKKKYTSAARRFLPIGMATKIGWSCNIRTLRHVLEQRTHPSAEEEIRQVFGKIGNMALRRWPVLFKDYERQEVEGYDHFTTKNLKV